LYESNFFKKWTEALGVSNVIVPDVDDHTAHDYWPCMDRDLSYWKKLLSSALLVAGVATDFKEFSPEEQYLGKPA
jgi:hypothetical protein